jgi:hypothetical protein
MVLLEDVDTADPGVADGNAARGWDRYLVVSDPDGVERLMSYEVIDSLEDAMKAISPRPAQSLARVETVSPTHVRDSEAGQGDASGIRHVRTRTSRT